MSKKRTKKSGRFPAFLIIALILALIIVIGVRAVPDILTMFGELKQPQHAIKLENTDEELAKPKPYYAPEYFYQENGLLGYSKSKYQIGIDVSAYQGIIDWNAVADSGVEFAILRAGYRGSSQGLLYEDETFRENLIEAKAAGLQVGVYFFSQARNSAEAAEEAEYTVALLEGASIDLPIFYDWEFIENSERIPELDEVPMTDCAVAFCERAEAKGYTAGVYFNQNYGYHYLDLSRLQNYTLWLAEYNETPSFQHRFDCLQFTDSGTVPGIGTAVDLNLLFVKEESDE